ncbi:histone H1-II-like [Phlebotomus papatasi]|uniref:histone H1-II-like n=1 Tax=Phlebotomus papatasi TaxID=29031 RepID=UPI002484100F|nr:histone H1-II-like [Phlebotomus papatasi]
MAEETSVEVAPAVSPAGKKTKAPKTAKKPRVKPTHPKTSEMVNNAIKDLKERGGSSLQAIKKFVAANYKVDAEKLAPFIRRYLKSAVTSGALVQTKGKGASGSFKLAGAKGEKAVAKKPRVKKASGEKKVKKAASPKKKATTTAKKAVAAKKPSGEKKKTAAPKKAAAKKSAPKQKSTKASSKSIGTKPKVPKPKKTGSPKKAAPKKTAAKKK